MRMTAERFKEIQDYFADNKVWGENSPGREMGQELISWYLEVERAQPFWSLLPPPTTVIEKYLMVDDPHAPVSEERQKHAHDWIRESWPKPRRIDYTPSEVFEARFDGELAYAEGTLKVRVWCSYKGTIDDPTLLSLKKKFDEVMEIGHVESAGSELKDVARLLSTLLGNATVELTTDNPLLGKIGIVYYPEWP